MPTCARPINTTELAGHFLFNALGKSEPADALIGKLVAQERLIDKFASSLGTLSDLSTRDERFANDEKRVPLLRQIASELFEMVRVPDEEIDLENGGCKPTGTLKSERKAFILIGPPASGKSGIADKIADRYGAYILDCDYAKRKLPEFRTIGGATLVHEESDTLLYGGGNLDKHNIEPVAIRCWELGYNIVMPLIGHDVDKLKQRANILMRMGYEIHLTLVNLDRKHATNRALERFDQTDRYVPLAHIFDYYGNQPTIAFYKLLNQPESEFKSLGSVSTEVEINQPPKLLHYRDENPAIWLCQS